MSALYELENLEKVYDGRRVLQVDGLVLEQGRTACLMGPNGSGKTTLLEILAFLSRPSGGTLRFQGLPVAFGNHSLRPLRQEVVLLEQHPILFSTSVFKNVAFGPAARGASRAEQQRRVEEALELVGLKEYLGLRHHRLSGGETQRVAIARALACRPRVLLLDEPTANVDSASQAAIEESLARIADERRMTVILATHDQGQASRLAHRRIYMERGRLVSGEAENVFRGRLEEAEPDGALFIAQGLRAAVDTERRGPASLALDPDRLVLQADGAEHPQGGVRGVLSRLVHENGRVLAVVDVGVSVRLRLDREDLRRTGLTVGDRVVVRVPPDAAQLL
jgi:tungstate transport system ATP-binding protein